MSLRKRIDWIDSIKAMGMFLVFYGHYSEFFFRQGDYPIAKEQFKIIYSFHMPLFFIVSGFFMKSDEVNKKTLHKLFNELIIPIFSFAVLTLPFWYLYQGATLRELAKMLLSYSGGSTPLNLMTWFLFCLFSAKILTYIIGVKKNIFGNFLISMLLIVLGYLIIRKIDYVVFYTKIEKNFWYIHEGIVAAGFLYLGKASYPLLERVASFKKLNILLLIITGVLFIISLKYLKNETIVFMVSSLHGNFFPFISHAILGSLFIILLGMLVPSNKFIIFYGKNTLILLGLNGFFFHFFNKDISKYTMKFTENSWIDLSLNCLLYCIISFIICYPLINVINKFLPQFFGKTPKRLNSK